MQGDPHGSSASIGHDGLATSHRSVFITTTNVPEVSYVAAGVGQVSGSWIVSTRSSRMLIPAVFVTVSVKQIVSSQSQADGAV